MHCDTPLGVGASALLRAEPVSLSERSERHSSVARIKRRAEAQSPEYEALKASKQGRFTRF